MKADDLQKEIRRLEDEKHAFLISCEIRDGKIVDATYTEYGENDFVLDIWNLKGTVCRVHRNENGALNFTKIYSDDSDRFYRWCMANCEAAGGLINRSGIYPIKKKIPVWLLTKIAEASK